MFFLLPFISRYAVVTKKNDNSVYLQWSFSFPCPGSDLHFQQENERVFWSDTGSNSPEIFFNTEESLLGVE